MGNFHENSLYQKQYAMSLGVAQVKCALVTFFIITKCSFVSLQDVALNF